mgnify:CR=1 FL=1
MASELKLELQPTTRAGQLAREEIRVRFGDNMPAPLMHDLTVVASELIANAVQHGPGNPIRVRIELGDDGIVRGEVADGGRGTVAIRHSDDPIDGLGLRIVDWLTDRWSVREGTSDVVFEMSAGDPPEPARDLQADSV